MGSTLQVADFQIGALPWFDITEVEFDNRQLALVNDSTTIFFARIFSVTVAVVLRGCTRTQLSTNALTTVFSPSPGIMTDTIAVLPVGLTLQEIRGASAAIPERLRYVDRVPLSVLKHANGA